MYITQLKFINQGVHDRKGFSHFHESCHPASTSNVIPNTVQPPLTTKESLKHSRSDHEDLVLADSTATSSYPFHQLKKRRLTSETDIVINTGDPDVSAEEERGVAWSNYHSDLSDENADYSTYTPSRVTDDDFSLRSKKSDTEIFALWLPKFSSTALLAMQARSIQAFRTSFSIAEVTTSPMAIAIIYLPTGPLRRCSRTWTIYLKYGISFGTRYITWTTSSIDGGPMSDPGLTSDDLDSDHDHYDVSMLRRSTQNHWLFSESLGVLKEKKYRRPVQMDALSNFGRPSGRPKRSVKSGTLC